MVRAVDEYCQCWYLIGNDFFLQRPVYFPKEGKMPEGPRGRGKGSPKKRFQLHLTMHSDRILNKFFVLDLAVFLQIFRRGGLSRSRSTASTLNDSGVGFFFFMNSQPPTSTLYDSPQKHEKLFHNMGNVTLFSFNISPHFPWKVSSASSLPPPPSSSSSLFSSTVATPDPPATISPTPTKVKINWYNQRTNIVVKFNPEKR